MRFENFPEGKMRHSDHRFEWSRKEFEHWGNKIANRYGYAAVFKPVGEIDEEVGALSQMGNIHLKKLKIINSYGDFHVTK